PSAVSVDDELRGPLHKKEWPGVPHRAFDKRSPAYSAHCSTEADRRARGPRQPHLQETEFLPEFVPSRHRRFPNFLSTDLPYPCRCQFEQAPAPPERIERQAKARPVRRVPARDSQAPLPDFEGRRLCARSVAPARKSRSRVENLRDLFGPNRDCSGEW